MRPHKTTCLKLVQENLGNEFYDKRGVVSNYEE
jgi:hypothetical protein